jgi:hypothetical protein
MTNKEKVLGYYGAEIFTEWTNNATFYMETCYTADSYDIYWCHSADDTTPQLDYDVYYYAENCIDVFKDALKSGELIYIDETLYDDIYVDDIIKEIAEAMHPEEVDGEILDTTD